MGSFACTRDILPQSALPVQPPRRVGLDQIGNRNHEPTQHEGPRIHREAGTDQHKDRAGLHRIPRIRVGSRRYDAGRRCYGNLYTFGAREEHKRPEIETEPRSSDWNLDRLAHDRGQPDRPIDHFKANSRRGVEKAVEERDGEPHDQQLPNQSVEGTGLKDNVLTNEPIHLADLLQIPRHAGSSLLVL